MKPVQQLFALVLELMTEFKVKKGRTGNRLPLWEKQLTALRKSYPDPAQYRKKEEALRNAEVKELLFDFYLKQSENVKTGTTDSSGFFKQPRLN